MSERILVFGATGYVGGRLVPLLLAAGHKVSAFTRSREKLASRPWGKHPALTIAVGDMFDLASVKAAVRGSQVVYYLVHSMEARHRDFWEMDRLAAYNLVHALKGGRKRRLIYLSGLEPDDPDASAHLRSRAEVARILALSDASLTTLRAAQIIGAGSASFEMLRWMVSRFPVMLTPRWTSVKTQPIAVTDALAYLVSLLDHPETAGKSYDIGGPDILSYEELIHLFADTAGYRRRLLIPAPFMTLGMSARWMQWTTPIPYALLRPLIEGLRNEVVCGEHGIRQVIPLDLTPIRTAFQRALGHIQEGTVKSSWSDAGLTTYPEWRLGGDAAYIHSSVYTDAYAIRLDATPDEVWQPVVRIGGQQGWYGQNALWRLRGLMDTFMGGPGTRRGRRHPTRLQVGDGLDFWRVLEVREGKRLVLFTEMRLPGEGILELCLEAAEPGTRLRLHLYYKPRGILGILYWLAVTPFHRLVFPAMLSALARKTGKPVLDPPARVAGKNA